MITGHEETGLEGTWASYPDKNDCREAITFASEGKYTSLYSCADSAGLRAGTYQMDDQTIYFQNEWEMPFERLWSVGNGFVKGPYVWAGPSLKLTNADAEVQYYAKVPPGDR